MKYIILVLWTFSLFLLMFSSFPFRVECRPTRAMGPGPPRPMGLTSQQLSSINYNQNLLLTCPVLEGPSAARFNPWPELYRTDITVKAWESPIVLEGTARSRSEVRQDGTFGVTFDLHRVVKGDAPLLRRRKQFRLQFLENPFPTLEEKNRDTPKNKNSNATSPNKPKINGINNSLNNLNNNFNSNNFNSHSRTFASGSISSLSGSNNNNNGIISSRQLHQPQNQLTLYQQQQQSRQQQQSQSRQVQQSQARQAQQQSRHIPQTSQSRQQQQLQLQSRQPQSHILQSNPNLRTFRNSSLPTAVQPYNNNMNNRNNIAGTRRAPSRNGRNAPNVFNPRPSASNHNSNSNKCLPPRATIKTGRKYYVFAAKVDNHFIAVFSAELANKRSTKQMDSILCKGCGQAPSVVAAKDVQLKVKERLRLRCRLRAGNPVPVLTWYKIEPGYKDGRPVNLTDTRFRLRPKRRQSILVIRKAKEMDAGVYKCEAKNVFGSAHAAVRVSLPSTSRSPLPPSKPLSTRPPWSKPVGTTPTTLWPLASSECPFDSYCLNGGTCSYYETIGEYVCQCAEGYKGQRCDTKDVPTSGSMYLSYFCIFGTINPDYPC